MALLSGARLGPYEILTSLGQGGMGEVYKARDTRLDRTVAIKVLPQHVASDLELKQRFAREAKTLAALSHPHICPVFDVGTATPSPGLRPPSPPLGGGEGQGEGAIDFLVMEYLEGETLATRLVRKLVPRRVRTCGRCRPAATGSRGSSSGRRSPKRTRDSRQTAGGWRIRPTNPVALRFSCSRSPDLAVDRRFRPMAERNQCRNGRELFYVNGDKMMAVEITTTPAFRAGTPRLLFEGRYLFSPNGVAAYDVASDGQRFLRVQPMHPDPPTNQIHVVLNWLEELKQLVATN